MSSKKDLVEAHSFNRRRLVTAFVSGAPGGREVEPVRYGRTLVGGLVLAGLVVAGAAVSPLLTQGLPEGWNQKGMVVGKESGSRFVASGGQLFPVINSTSARLVLGGQGDFKVTFVPDDKIAEQKQGPTIGIPGAPDLLPAPSKLVQTGWTACTSEARGIGIDLRSRPAAAASGRQAFVAASADGGEVYLVTGGHKYPVPSGATGRTVLRALGVDREKPTRVPGLWLDLVPLGSTLAPFSVPGAGSRVDTGVSGLDRVGTPVEVDGQPYVLGRSRLLPLSRFAYTVYASSRAAVGSTVTKRAADIPSLKTNTDPGAQPYAKDWPKDDVTPYTRSDSPCLLLATHPDAGATVRLATPLTSSLLSSTGATTRTVQSGHGALVRSASGGVIGSGTLFLVDPTGTRYALGAKGAEDQAVTALGYQGVTPAAVPPAWLELFADGPALTVAAAARSTAGQS